MRQFLISISFALLLFGFYACEKGTSIITKEIKETTHQKVSNERTLVAIVLSEEVFQLEKTDRLIEKLLIREQSKIDRLNNNTGEPAFWDWNESKGFNTIEQSKLKMDDLQLKKEFATLSHLTTFKSTPVEIFKYDYALDEQSNALSRIISRGVSIIIVSTAGRPPSGFSF